MSVCGHLGNYNTATSRTHVRFSFSTHEAAGGNVAPLSAFEAADLRIYKATDGAALSDVERNSAVGITMTSPFDSLTGVHAVDIDLSDNTHAGFYATGCYYEVHLCPDETIDGQTITGVCLCSFEVGDPVLTAIATLPTNAQMEARTLPSAGYASPTNITAGTITTVTNLTNLPTMPTDWITALGVSAGAANKVADAYLDRADAVEAGLTPRQAMRLSTAVDAGKLSGAATTTIVIRNAVADSKARVTATVDSSGNRSAVTYDLS